MTRLPETAKPLGSLGVGMKAAGGVTGPNCRTSRWRVMLVVLVGRLVSRGWREGQQGAEGGRRPRAAEAGMPGGDRLHHWPCREGKGLQAKGQGCL